MTEEELNAEDKVVVSLNNKKDKESFCKELATAGNVSPHVPSREVEIKNIRAECWYTFDCFMSRREMIELEKDPRVSCCRFGSKRSKLMASEQQPPRPDRFGQVHRGQDNYQNVFGPFTAVGYKAEWWETNWAKLHVNTENDWLTEYPNLLGDYSASDGPNGKPKINYTTGNN